MNKQNSSANGINSSAANRRCHVIVIGGSLAGLLAARVLTDHFERVTVIERDRYPVGPDARKGVPQARHAHVLLGRGQQILRELFPGLAEEMESAGVPVVDPAGDIAWLTPAGWSIRFRSSLAMLSASRDLLEWSIRRRVAALPRIQILEDTDVSGLVPAASGRGICGALIHRRHPGEGEPSGDQRLDADLVVDASGRGSHAPRWLTALGYAAPEETVVDSFLGYASRLYRCPGSLPAHWKAVYLQSKPPGGTRGGLILPVEGNRWLVTLSGRGGDYPPTDEAGFVAFARSLASPIIHEAFQGAEPLSAIVGYRGTANRLRHFERLERWPEGFVVLGDASCAFNPVYGQGMTTAALGAVTLGECLRQHAQRHSEGMAMEFQRQLAQVNTTPWLLATGEDYRYPTTVGGRPGWFTRLLHRYVDRVVKLGRDHASVQLTFLQVLHLLKPPSALFRPGILWAVLKQAFWATGSAGNGAPPRGYEDRLDVGRVAPQFGNSMS
jgi:2-polyprenyl-6-methoxyphenol hydroxylase-like FAD-dependent oxidoreductase